MQKLLVSLLAVIWADKVSSLLYFFRFQLLSQQSSRFLRQDVHKKLTEKINLITESIKEKTTFLPGALFDLQFLFYLFRFWS